VAGIAKSTTTPAHLTTLPVKSHRLPLIKKVLCGSSKALRSPQLITWQATQPVRQTSRMSSAAKPPPPRPRAKRGKREPMQDFQARQENCSPE